MSSKKKSSFEKRGLKETRGGVPRSPSRRADAPRKGGAGHLLEELSKAAKLPGELFDGFVQSVVLGAQLDQLLLHL